MAGASGAEDSQFKGFARYFNTTTNFGRRNISAITLGSVAFIALVCKLKPSSKKPEVAAK
jgi:hypothetical protein